MKTALQLWTIRHAAADDLNAALAQVAGIGYGAVEFAGLHGHDAAAVKHMLAVHGLTACGAHIGFDAAFQDTAATVTRLHTLGCPALVLPTVPRGSWTPDLAGRLNALGRTLASEGVTLVLHNETDEFAPWQGSTLWHTLLPQLNPACVRLQLDLFTAVQMGQDPLALIDAAAGRLHSLHVIDWRAGAYTRIGAGDADWPGILQHAQSAGCAWLIVEHDAPPEPFADAAASLQVLKRLIV
jgi:sugar phosphate isomerase/epimerase